MKINAFGGSLLLGLATFGAGAWATNVGATELKIKCLKDDGKVLGGVSGDTCKNALPKCSDIKKTIEKTVAEQLSMKIYGFYKGYDIDLKKTTPDTLVGTKMPVQICSVVGHHIKYQGHRDLEFNVRNHGSGNFAFRGDTQSINGAPCGEAPQVQINTDDRKVLVGFQGTNGSRWASWMLGTMPYVIRANFHRFSQAFTDMGKLDGLLNSPLSEALKDEYAMVNTEVESYFKLLPEEAKATCEDPAYQDMVDSCMKKPGSKEFLPTDPALRACEIVKAQMTLAGGSVSNMVLGEIMEDARAEYDAKIGMLLKSDSPGWKELNEKASDHTAWWDCWLSARRKCGAVAVSGIMGSGFYAVYKDYSGHESDDSLLWNRKGERYIAFYLDRDKPEAVLAWGPPPEDGKSRMKAYAVFPDWFESFLLFTDFLVQLYKVLGSRDTYLSKVPTGSESLTLASGFPGLVEYAVRHQVCGQKSTTDSSSQCDETAIPDKPAGVTW